MYASIDFKSKHDFKQAVLEGQSIILYSPQLGMPAINGKETVTGPWNPPIVHGHPKEWVARVEVKDMRIIAVY